MASPVAQELRSPLSQTMEDDVAELRAGRTVSQSTSKVAVCTPSCLSNTLCVLGAAGCCCLNCVTVEENTEGVVLLWGKLWRKLTDPGLYFLNSCGVTVTKISRRQRVVNLETVKVADLNGNPLMISAIVTYRVMDAVAAALDVENLDRFVEENALATMKSVAAQYPYEVTPDSPEGAHSLKSDAGPICAEMVTELQRRVDVAGTRVLSFALTDLAYSSEIAGAMLVRQQAQALVDARKLIVAGAVEIATQALHQLETNDMEFSPAEKARTVGNLLTVICGDASVTPTVSVGATNPTG